jgi:L-2-hydroxyglutarate oxidase LhgO
MNSSFDIDVLIIGAGCVGLAVGRAFAMAGRSVIVAERHAGFGEETSSRNSEVIHAGLYYPPGTLKAKACVEGQRALYAYCAARNIRADKMGKLIVATNEDEVARLAPLMEWGQANGVGGLAWLDSGDIARLEPEVRAVQALWSPESGLFDSHSYMLALLGEIEDAGGALVRKTPFEGATPIPGGFEVRLGGAEPTTIKTSILVLSAGLNTPAVAAAVEGLPSAQIPPVRFAKGSYFKHSGKAPFRHLIYPAPGGGGHGIHVTPEQDGSCRFGPDFEMVESLDYRVDPARRDMFAHSIQRYWPKLNPERLQTDYSGIRPKIGADPSKFCDFRIDGPAQHGLEGLYGLYGIDSPGLTSSLSLGNTVCALALGREDR